MTWAEGSPLEERVYSRRRPVASTGARRRRACVERSRPPLSLWWLVLERERERRRHFPSVGRSLAPLVCKKLRVCIRLNRHGYYYYYVIAPGSGRGRARPQLAPPSSQCESCAFPSCSRDLPLSRSARAPPRPSRSTSRTVVSLNRGSRILGFDTRSGLRK